MTKEEIEERKRKERTMHAIAAETARELAKFRSIGKDSTNTKDTDMGTDGNFEKRCRAEWEKDENLRNEFAGKFEVYLAYKTENPGITVKQANGKGCSREKFNSQG